MKCRLNRFGIEIYFQRRQGLCTLKQQTAKNVYLVRTWSTRNRRIKVFATCRADGSERRTKKRQDQALKSASPCINR